MRIHRYLIYLPTQKMQMPEIVAQVALLIFYISILLEVVAKWVANGMVGVAAEWRVVAAVAATAATAATAVAATDTRADASRVPRELKILFVYTAQFTSWYLPYIRNIRQRRLRSRCQSRRRQSAVRAGRVLYFSHKAYIYHYWHIPFVCRFSCNSW